MLTVEENERLTKVGPGTPMGDLMRRYWHPIAAAAELDENPFRTKVVQILGEELVLFRDRSGKLGLIDKYCAHRRADLSYGMCDEDGIRCPYHGWKYDATGQCVEQPFEETVRPEAHFKDKIQLTAYRAEELGGLIFAYLGPEPAPLLPRWAPLVWDNCVRDVAISELPCNWLQCQENSLDPVHVEWLHNQFTRYVKGIRGQAPLLGAGLENVRKHQKIGFDTFEYGIIKRRVLEGFTEADDDWKEGHPILFPHILLVGSQFSATLQFRVPIDDNRTYHVSYYVYRAAPGTEAPAQEQIPYRNVPLYDDSKRFIVDLTFNQDYAMWIGQGAVAKRHLEKLGESDRGIILFRQMLEEQMGKVQRGEDPMNTFRDPAANVCVTPPLEHIKFGSNRRPAKYMLPEAGLSTAIPDIERTQATWDLVGAGNS
ncbi:MAG: 5,5-dehydrodivanillate O-demethylase oxygenase subunit [Chloroflexota bacterium]|jgi:5,5'-dehydrodivanillate O-demethylase|nr:5,5-dehydrodivanillate O-demethylase oxygenase subunit [Chloroflexota bacterium]